ncbi:MAG: sulfatase-like hydrolase/transferase [Armatimonadota bacterium]|nr:sulfatase-like hydrolase/transferase [Armatimonadota bacterium]
MRPGKLPNILWLTWEDATVTLRCFGDPYAYTPNIDRVAQEGVRFVNVFTHSPVCAPSRSGIITGMYPTSIGSHHMRCAAVPPPFVRTLPELLRERGYYCTNNVKTDYNFIQHPEARGADDYPHDAWDECSRQAHWRNRPEGTPFFSVFNFMDTHESRIRIQEEWLLKELEALPSEARHPPERARVPAYHPDTPTVRKDWARHYDTVSLVDQRIGELLRQLEEDGLLEETILWLWSDHGPGMPRMKRWIYDGGIHVPLIIRVPERYRELVCPNDPTAWQPGGVNDDLIAVVDYAPTMLSIIGVQPPEWMQGQAFLGKYRALARQYVFAARDRMDETYDLIRAVRDKRYKYIRNFLPHLPYAQEIRYAEETPSLQEVRRLHAEGRLEPAVAQFFQPSKPVEELYDIQSDPDEVRNLAGDPRYQLVLERMRRELYRWMEETGDLGLIPEPLLDEMMRPEGTFSQTSAPVVRATPLGSGQWRVSWRCRTPGASIIYRRRNPDGAADRWQLYTRPLLCREGEELVAKACRLGCRDSEETVYRVGSPPPESKAQHHSPPDWHRSLRRNGVLQRLLRLKALDGRTDESALRQYERALRDRHPAMRYWAVVGLQNACSDEPTRKRFLPALRQLRNDPSEVVRVALAETLCLWGDLSAARQLLAPLLVHRQEHVRLFAISVLRRCSALARQLMAPLQRAREDRSEDVRKAAQTVLERVERGDSLHETRCS